MSGGRREDTLRVDFKHRGADQLVRQRAVVRSQLSSAKSGSKWHANSLPEPPRSPFFTIRAVRVLRQSERGVW